MIINHYCYRKICKEQVNLLIKHGSLAIRRRLMRNLCRQRSHLSESLLVRLEILNFYPILANLKGSSKLKPNKTIIKKQNLSSSNQQSMSRISEDNTLNYNKNTSCASNSNERMRKMMTIYNSKFLSEFIKGMVISKSQVLDSPYKNMK